MAWLSASRATSLCVRRALDAQQRRDGLQVVLHPVVDLADRRVLGDQLLLLVPHLADVAHQHDRADPLPAMAHRDGAQRHRDPARLDVGAPRRATGHHERQRLVDDELAGEQPGRHLGERLALELADEPHPVERRQAVRAGERHDAVDVEPDETVGCARGAAARTGSAPRGRGSRRSRSWRTGRWRHWLKVSSWRLGVRASLRLLCRVSTAIGVVVVAAPLGLSRRSTGHRPHPGRRLLVPVGRRGVDDLAPSRTPRSPARATPA